MSKKKKKNDKRTQATNLKYFFLSLNCRNELYVVIERGDFERGGKSSGKNIEVTVFVIDDVGQIIEVIYIRPSLSRWNQYIYLY